MNINYVSELINFMSKGIAVLEILLLGSSLHARAVKKISPQVIAAVYNDYVT